MKKKILMLCMGCFFVSLTAKAQWVVTDPTNLAQGIINAARNIVQTSTTATNKPVFLPLSSRICNIPESPSHQVLPEKLYHRKAQRHVPPTVFGCSPTIRSRTVLPRHRWTFLLVRSISPRNACTFLRTLLCIPPYSKRSTYSRRSWILHFQHCIS